MEGVAVGDRWLTVAHLSMFPRGSRAFLAIESGQMPRSPREKGLQSSAMHRLLKYGGTGLTNASEEDCKMVHFVWLLECENEVCLIPGI
jgi:hypothetical protein